jgi:GT2 family glycosyltransferase
LWGVNDPLAYYFDKRDRLSWAEDSWAHAGNVVDMGYYYLVTFNPENMPTLGANGFLAKKDVLLNAKCSPSEFFHIDVNYDLVKLGYDTYGIVKGDIIHLTGNSFFSFLRKRMIYMTQYYLNNQSARRYKMYSPTQDKQKLALFIFNSFTLLKPVYDSIKGYKRITDTAWFLHPLMCLCILFIYGSAICEQNLKFFVNILAKKRKLAQKV